MRKIPEADKNILLEIGGWMKMDGSNLYAACLNMKGRSNICIKSLAEADTASGLMELSDLWRRLAAIRIPSGSAVRKILTVSYA